MIWHTRTFAALLVAALLLLGVAGRAQQGKQTAATALVGGTLIDGNGGAPVRNSVVLVRGERVERVGTVDSLPVPAGYERIDTEGMTVMPGLWDMHVHLVFTGYPGLEPWLRNYGSQLETVIMPAAAQQLLMAGVTSTRDLAAPMTIFNVRKRIDRGEIPGPTIYASGPQFTRQPAVWAVQQIGLAGPDDARAKTRKLVEGGADVIKFVNAEGLTPDETKAIVEESRKAGKMVVAHGRTDAEIKLGLAAGVDELEHIGLASPEYPEDVMAAIRARVATGRRLYWGPTVSLQLRGGYLQENPEILDEPAGLRGLSPAMADDLRKSLASYKPQWAPTTVQIIKRKIEQLRGAGVELVFGTDGGLAGNAHSSATWQELDAWVNTLGMPAMEVITLATSKAAALQGANESGSVTAGKYADIIVVPGDPLRHIDVTRNPAVVIKHGRRYK